jgi:hypothetical protein
LFLKNLESCYTEKNIFTAWQTIMENSNPPISQLSANQELKDAVYRLLKYAASDANLDVDDQLINDVAPVLQKDIHKLTVDDEKALWFGYNALSILVFPATNESLWLKEHMERDDRARAEGNTAEYSSTAKAYKKTYASFKWIGYVFGIIFFFLQTYTSMLADSVEQVNQYYTEITKIEEQILTAKQANPNILPCESPLKEFNAQEDQIMLKIDSHYRAMQDLSSAFWGYFYASDTVKYYLKRKPQCPNLPIPYANVNQSPEFSLDMEQRAKAERTTFFEGAKSALHLCNYLILPLILGILGSVAYVIRSILDGFAKSSLTFSSHRRGSMRVYLGALLGLISGVIIVPDLKEIQTISYSPLVWAFLMGYSVEFAFTLFDALISRGRGALEALKVAPTVAKKESAPEDNNEAKK